jgi:hypothetical protein
VFSGGSGTVTATSTVNVGPTPYYIDLYDVDSGALLASCGFGTTCQASVSWSTQHVAAFIATFNSSLASMAAQACSSTVVVNPG